MQSESPISLPVLHVDRRGSRCSATWTPAPGAQAPATAASKVHPTPAHYHKAAKVFQLKAQKRYSWDEAIAECKFILTATEWTADITKPLAGLDYVVSSKDFRLSETFE
jgi:hypothetical protein